jgi:hypothetical protein
MSLLAQGPMQFAPFMTAGGGGIQSEWADRVVANGGDRPSESTIAAMEQLRTDIVTAGISNKFWSLCVFVPDSLIAATTPLIRKIGADPWTNSNFTADLLNVNGLKGNGTNAFLDTGILCRIVTGDARSPLSTNISFSTVISEGYNVPGQIGLAPSGSEASRLTVFFSQSVSGGGLAVALIAGGSQTQYYVGPTGDAGNRINTNEVERIGFVSANKFGAASGIFIGVASPVEPFGILSTNAAGTTGNHQAGVTNTIPFLATRVETTNAGFSYGRFSMAAIHEGLTVTECSNFWNAIKTCRQSLGGGTGEPVHNWAARIANLNGSTISSTTSNAVRDFVAGLYTDGLAYKMVAVNPIAPDNLTAAATPIIWQGGYNTWSNVNYAASNLNVNGLAGTGETKYLDTRVNIAGLNTTGMRGFLNTSAGASVLVSQINTFSNSHIWGVLGTAASSFFGIVPCDPSTNYSAFVFKYDNPGTDSVVARGPVTNFTTFATASRTAANALALYFVTNGVHHLAVAGTGNQTGSTATMTNMVLGGYWSESVPAVGAGFSPYRASFAAVHAGLTQTQASNLWTRVNAMRTAMGGGNPL